MTHTSSEVALCLSTEYGAGVPAPYCGRTYGNSVPDEYVPGIEATSFGVTDVFVRVTFVY